MAKKKVTEEVVPEVVEEVKEEKPKAAKKTSTKKKVEKVEEPIVEKVEEPVVEEVKEVPEVAAPTVEVEPVAEAPVVEEVKEEPIVVEKPKKSKKVEKVEKVEVVEEPAPTPVVEDKPAEFPYLVMVNTKNVLPIFNGAGISFRKIGTLTPGTKVLVKEVIGNWANIGKDRWININFVEKI